MTKCEIIGYRKFSYQKDGRTIYGAEVSVSYEDTGKEFEGLKAASVTVTGDRYDTIADFLRLGEKVFLFSDSYVWNGSARKTWYLVPCVSLEGTKHGRVENYPC